MTMWFTARGEIAEGTTVAGTDIGGVVPAEAERILSAAVAEQLDDPIRLMIDGQPVDLVPAEAGVQVDIAATLSRAEVTESVDPWELWDHFTGDEAIEPSTSIRERTFRKVMHGVDIEVGAPPRNAKVVVTADGVEVTAPRDGLAVDREAVRSLLLGNWYGEDSTVLLTLDETEPEIGGPQVRTFTDQFLDPALSGPVDLTFAGKPLRLPASMFGPTIKVRPVNGVLEGHLDQQAFNALVRPSIEAARTRPANARWVLADGVPTILKSRPGRIYTTEGATSAFLGVLLRTNDRSSAVRAQVTQPGWTTADAKKLRIDRVVGEASRATEWSKNSGIEVGAMSGVVVKPDTSFNLSRYVDSVSPELLQAFRDAAQQAGLNPAEGGFTNSTSTGFMVQVWTSTEEKQERIPDRTNGGDKGNDDNDAKKHAQKKKDYRTVYRDTVTFRLWGA
ncbi:MAG: hypothetical protein ACSLEW_04630 [Nocardioides sp.]